MYPTRIKYYHKSNEVSIKNLLVRNPSILFNKKNTLIEKINNFDIKFFFERIRKNIDGEKEL
jgi:hypothetical protein